MNMHTIDWGIITGLLIVMTVAALYTRKYTRTVSDFLSANRCGRRYLLATAEGAANMGAISIMAMFEMFYQAGFTAAWWRLMLFPAAIVVALSGWVIYRFRQTRAMTMAQFFEIRYGRRFRIFAGILAWGTGIINFGIFPAVGARFFVYFCGMPDKFLAFGLSIPTFAVVMIVLLSIALFFTFLGGQIAIMVTDFIQGIFNSVAAFILVIVMFSLINWTQIGEALKSEAVHASLVNPFSSQQVKDFNVVYFLISVFVLFYCHLSWQGSQGFNSAAQTPHEARMGKILGSFRETALLVPMALIPIFAYVVMHHPDFTVQAVSAKTVLGDIGNSYIQKQMTVPIALSRILPAGAIGLMCTIIFAAFIANCNSYMHSWGSIFIQDVILPLRGKPFTPQQHIKLLRLSIVGVAVFVFLWSLIFRQTTQIYFYFAITGTIYLSGSGAAIIGGLYWKRGTAGGAWVAMILGATLGVSGIVIYQIWPNFPINGQIMWFFAMISALSAYIIVSLFGRKVFDMNKLLHRGAYSIEQDTVVAKSTHSIMLERLGITREFTLSDKIIFFISIAWTLVWVVIFIVGTIYNLTRAVSSESWMKFWKIYIVANLGYFAAVSIWLIAGGMSDLRKMFASLATRQISDSDDGSVADDINKKNKSLC